MMYNTCMRLISQLSLSIFQIEIIVISVLAFAVAIFIIVFFGFLNRSESNHIKDIKDLSNKTRIYVVDVENDTVSYFNADHLKDRKSSSITVFYNLYESKDREKLINWIGDLIEQNSTTSKYLEISIWSRSAKQMIPTILEVQKIDLKKHIIYLESHVLQTSFKAHKKGEKLVFAERETLYKKILLNNGKGATYFFNLYNNVTKSSDISRVAYADLRDIILSFSNENVVMFEEQTGQILITNFTVKGKAEMLAYANVIKSKINRFLLLNSYSEDIFLSIGIIENSENFRDVNTLVKNVIAVSNLCKDTEDHIAFFSDIKKLLTEEEGKQYRTDVQNIIAENKLQYLFQPIIDVDRGRVVAYKSSVVPLDSFFQDIKVLKNYAKRTEDDKDLFSTITKNTISRFVQERDEYNLKLFFPVSFSELDYVSKTLSRTDGVNDVNIVLVLFEKDLANLPEDYEESRLIDIIRNFKSKGYSVALEIDDDILTLSPNLYGVFDYFNLSVATHIAKKSTGSSLPTFQGLIEKLLHYEKPLVALDIQSWDILELVYRLGISRICSDAVALPAENIMPLQKKTLTKIKNLKS